MTERFTQSRIPLKPVHGPTRLEGFEPVEEARAIRSTGVAAASGPTANTEEVVATVECLARRGASGPS